MPDFRDSFTAHEECEGVPIQINVGRADRESSQLLRPRLQARAQLTRPIVQVGQLPTHGSKHLALARLMSLSIVRVDTDSQ